MNLITPACRLNAFQEVREGKVFCLSLRCDYPGGNVLNMGICETEHLGGRLLG